MPPTCVCAVSCTGIQCHSMQSGGLCLCLCRGLYHLDPPTAAASFLGFTPALPQVDECVFCFLFLCVRVLFFVLFALFAASFLVVFWAIRACVARPHCVRDLRQSEPAAVHHLDSFFSIRLLCFICRFILFPSGLLLRRCCCRCLCCCLFVYLFFLALFIIWLATF